MKCETGSGHKSKTTGDEARIRVRFFAQAREAVGADGCTLERTTPESADQICLEIERLYPKLSAVLHRSAIAVNRKYVSRDHRVCPGDEIAIIPPVAGG